MSREPRICKLILTENGTLRISGSRRIITPGDLLAVYTGSYWISGIVSLHKNSYVVANFTMDCQVLHHGTLVKIL